MLRNRWLHPVLEPIDRTIEVLCGVIMVLTFTETINITKAGQANVHVLLAASIGCNFVWGIIDAIMYVLNSLGRRGRRVRVFRSLHTSTERDGPKILARELPRPIAAVLQHTEIETLLQRLRQQPHVPVRIRLVYDDFLAAVGIFLLVFLSTFPVVLPFLIVKESTLALRLSNVVALVLLFMTGFLFGRVTNHRPWAMGLVLALLGCLLTGLAIALGG